MIDRLRQDLKNYMKQKDALKLNVIRGILNEISIREMKNIEINTDEILKVLRSEVKKRKESIESFEKGGRKDLIEKEAAEIKVVEQYLPKELSDEDLLAIIKQVVEKSEDKSFGVLMKASIAAVNGQADGKRISAVIKKITSSLQA